MTKEKKIDIICYVKDAAIILGLVATFIAVWGKTSGSMDKYVDSRALKVTKDETAPIVRELVFLNCMFRVSLTPEQQKEAEKLYEQVTKIGEK